MRRDAGGAPGGISFHHPAFFWIGVVAVTAGVVLHLPMFYDSRDVGFKMNGMAMDMTMMLGMLAIVAGIGASLYGLLPPGRRVGGDTFSSGLHSLDVARIGWAHVSLLAVMAVAVTIDVMKPTAGAFVLPGMAQEYNLKSPLNPTGSTPAALLPFWGISGMVVGSLLWGWLGDRIGRRSSILFAGILFVATSVCGAMPDFAWNLFMCFLMGVGAGGMLPIAYALMAETIPARHRGWLMVLIGADIAGAYVLTSWLAASLIPLFSWRIMWLIGLPTGLLLILLNRWIPESPRFLLAMGRDDEARAVMARFGASFAIQTPRRVHAAEDRADGWRRLVSGPLLGRTIVVATLSVGAGLVLFGFNLWIPTNLRKLGIAEADTILRNSALMGLPLTFVVAWAYGFWSSKKTMLVLATLTAAALLGFGLGGEAVLRHRPLLYLLLVIPIWGISSVIAVLSVYASEIYPTPVRSRGSGFAAGVRQVGGWMLVGMVVVGVAPPSSSEIALIGAVPMSLAALAIAVFGVETRNRPLEDIDAVALHPARPVVLRPQQRA